MEIKVECALIQRKPNIIYHSFKKFPAPLKNNENILKFLSVRFLLLCHACTVNSSVKR